MDHGQVEQNEIVERYVRNQLTPEDRQAFQEHYFSCDRCFEQVQATERFVAGVKHAAEAGVLARTSYSKHAGPAWLGWLNTPRRAGALAILALVLGVAWLFQVSTLRGKLALEQQARERVEQSQQSLQERIARLEQQGAVSQLQANIPLVILEASRDTGPVTLTLFQGAPSFVLWIDVRAEAFSDFQMKIYRRGNQAIQTIEGLHKNSYGALAASLPARSFPEGEYRVKLFATDGPQALLRGDYKLQIRSK